MPNTDPDTDKAMRKLFNLPIDFIREKGLMDEYLRYIDKHTVGEDAARPLLITNTPEVGEAAIRGFPKNVN